MKNRLIYILLTLAFLAGIGIMAYPSVSDWWNSFHQSRAIASYTEAVTSLDTEEYERMLSAAQAYNEKLSSSGERFNPTEEELAEYESLLDLSDTGMMGFIDIPVISCYLPLYHGTNEAVLQTAVGHIEWSSLPVGGEGSHCVLSGHRGLPSAKLFTDLDKLVVGDLFKLSVLDEILTYEVDQILIVEPEDISALQIVPGEDYCTLVTCTPYGINTHRLLVRGRRVSNEEEAHTVRVTADSVQVEELIVAPVVGVPLLILLLAFQIYEDRKRKRDGIEDL